MIEARTSGIVIGRWWLMTGDGAEQATAAVVDQGGYTIRFNGGSLTVPAGAVSAPTVFNVVLRTHPYIAADLTASTLFGRSVSTFPVPLTLTLSYASAGQTVVDPSHISIFWMQNGLLVEREPTTANAAARTVSASITHFSEYSPGVDVQCDPDPASLNPCP
jgi:hypothetical protein